MFPRILLFLITIALTLPVALPAAGQRTTGGPWTPHQKQAGTLADTITMTAARYATSLDSIIMLKRQHRLTGVEKTLTNPYYFPLFSSATLYSTPLYAGLASLPSEPLSPDPHAFSLAPRATNAIQKAMLYSYAKHPTSVRFDLTTPIMRQTPAEPDPKDKDEKKLHSTDGKETPDDVAKKGNNVQETFMPGDFKITVRRPNFWTVKGNFSLKFMQYYFSDNWYKGGDDYLSMLGEFKIEANYDNKQKFSVYNCLETRLGFQTTKSDTYHKFKTNNDLLRLTNKFSLKAIRNWNYTLMVQSWTQFYKTFNANSDVVTSDFMSPFESVISLGMTYHVSKKKLSSFDATISPIAIGVKYCDRSAIVGRFGIENGKHSKSTFGSTATVTSTVKFTNSISWGSRYYIFYDYKNLKMEWENTINLRVNKYLSTKIFLYPRFDNSVKKTEDNDTYFQFNEYLSIGFDCSF